jgi:hypothetical protein
MTKKITTSLYFYERKMYFPYSVEIYVQQNIAGWDEKRVNIIVKAIVTLQDEEVPNYFLFILFRAMIMTS